MGLGILAALGIVGTIVWVAISGQLSKGPGILLAASAAVALVAAVLYFRKMTTVAAKELRSYFVSPMGYVILAFYLGVCGLIFGLSVTGPQPQAEMGGMFHTMVFVTLMMAPVITMGLLAQENASGSIELLMTNPVRDWEVVLGKYLGALALFALVLIGSLEFPLLLEAYGDPDWMAVLSGYAGLILVGMAFIAIGLFASSLTANQIASAIIGYLALLFFWLIGWLGYTVSENVGDVARYISVYENFQDFAKGIVDSRPLIFFATVTFFFLFLAIRALENRRTV